jgi:hypothetical protein
MRARRPFVTTSGETYPVTVLASGIPSLVDVTAMGAATYQRLSGGIGVWGGRFDALEARDEAALRGLAESGTSVALQLPDGHEPTVLLRVGGEFEGIGIWGELLSHFRPS